MQTQSPEWDLVVVGAGPAGSAAALAARAARSQARVLVIDRQPPGRDKVCGDGIGPDVVHVLESLGAGDTVRASEEVTRFRLYVSGGPQLTGRPPEPGYVIPRAVFDRRLLDQAVASGAEFVHDRWAGLTQTDSSVQLSLASGRKLTTRYVVAADGAYSPIRRSLGIEPNRGKHMAVALRGYTAASDATDRELVIGWDRSLSGLAYVWKFPLADGSYNIGYGATLRSGPLPRSFLLERMETLLDNVDLSGVELTGHQLPLASQRPPVAHGRVLLTGDAASLINPLSGEGIVYALMSGKMAGAAAVSSDRPGLAYSKALRSTLGRHHRHVSFLSAVATPSMVAGALVAAQASGRSQKTILDLALGNGHLSLRDLPSFGLGVVSGLTTGRKTSS